MLFFVISSPHSPPESSLVNHKYTCMEDGACWNRPYWRCSWKFGGFRWATTNHHKPRHEKMPSFFHLDLSSVSITISKFRAVSSWVSCETGHLRYCPKCAHADGMVRATWRAGWGYDSRRGSKFVVFLYLEMPGQWFKLKYSGYHLAFGKGLGLIFMSFHRGIFAPSGVRQVFHHGWTIGVYADNVRPTDFFTFHRILDEKPLFMDKMLLSIAPVDMLDAKNTMNSCIVTVPCFFPNCWVWDLRCSLARSFRLACNKQVFSCANVWKLLVKSSVLHRFPLSVSIVDR